MRSTHPPPIGDAVRSLDDELAALRDARRVEIEATLAEVAHICTAIEARSRRMSQSLPTEAGTTPIARVALKRVPSASARASASFRAPEPSAHVDLVESVITPRGRTIFDP
jgi:hypothetical protein